MYVLRSDDYFGGTLVPEEFTGPDKYAERFREFGNWFDTLEEAKAAAKPYNTMLLERGKKLTANDEYFYCVYVDKFSHGTVDVAKIRRGSEKWRVWDSEESLRHWGNYFETEEEAGEFARQINTMLHKRGKVNE